MTPEAKEKATLKAYLNEIGAYHFWPVPLGYGKQGVDCYACILGDFWGIEVKPLSRQPTARQQATMITISKANGHAVAGTASEIIQHIHHVLRSKN